MSSVSEVLVGRKVHKFTPALDEFVNWVIQAHRDTNHYYDDYLPYEFHLRMVAENGKRFLHLLPENVWEDVMKASYGHDLVEDARQNYSSILKRSNKYVAEICRACTNYGRGRNRQERMPDFIYQDIFDTPGAVFVKLCDRIANAQYSKLTRSKMFKLYKEEHAHFKKMLYSKESGLDEMWEYLEGIFNSPELI